MWPGFAAVVSRPASGMAVRSARCRAELGSRGRWGRGAVVEGLDEGVMVMARRRGGGGPGQEQAGHRCGPVLGSGP